MLPVLPLANIYVGVGLRSLAKWLHTRKYYVAILYLVLHLPLALYFSFVHMRGPLSIMSILRYNIAEESITAPPISIISVHFLMPCYSTPLNTYLHVDVLKKKRLRFRVLDCPPLVQPKRSESARFIASPTDFVHDEYHHHGVLLPDFIVLFDIHAIELRPWLESVDYVEVRRVFHAHFSGDADSNETYRQIILFKRRTSLLKTECSSSI